MASGTLPSPGTEFGPCADVNCGHVDCGLTRGMAEAVCEFCGEPIGYDCGFYNRAKHGEPQRLAHAGCLENDVEMRR